MRRISGSMHVSPSTAFLMAFCEMLPSIVESRNSRTSVIKAEAADCGAFKTELPLLSLQDQNQRSLIDDQAKPDYLSLK
jgi:hypothetical protein